MGSLRQRAEVEYSRLSPEEQLTMRHILLRMVAISDGGEMARRRVPHHELVYQDDAENKRVARVLENLIEARLVVSDETHIEPAHDALVRAWGRLIRWRNAFESILPLALQRRLTQATEEWSNSETKQQTALLWNNNPNLSQLALLLPGASASRQTEQIDRYWLNRDERAFISQSVKLRSRRQRQLFLGITLVLVVAISTAFSFYSQNQDLDIQTQEALQAQKSAEENADEASRQRDEALRTQSGFLADLSKQEMEKGDFANSLSLALEALPGAETNPDRPLVLEARSQLHNIARELRGVMVHAGSVHFATFSPDNNLIVTASNDNVARLWSRDGNLLKVLEGHEGTVTYARFSPDGRTLVIVSYGKTARLWSSDGKLLKVLEGHKGEVTHAEFSPDGKYIVTTSNDKTARLWLHNGKLITVLEGHSSLVGHAEFSPDGQRIVTASSDSTARLWSIDGKLLEVLDRHTGEVAHAEFSPDGRYIVTTSYNHMALLWSRDGKLLEALKGHRGAVTQAIFSPDGTRILTTDIGEGGEHSGGDIFSGTAQLWSSDGRFLKVLEGHTGRVVHAAFSPDSLSIITIDDGNTQIAEQWKMTDSWVDSIPARPGIARLWSRDGDLLKVIEGHTDTVTHAEFSPDSRHIVTTSDDRTARLWSHEGEPFNIIEKLHEEAQPDGDNRVSVSFSPNGKHIVTSNIDGKTKLWSHDGELIAVLKGSSVRFSPGGERIVTLSDEELLRGRLRQTLRLWSLKGDLLKEHPEHTEIYGDYIEFGPGDKRIAVISNERTVALWSNDGEPLALLEGHSEAVNDVKFSPDGTKLITVGKYFPPTENYPGMEDERYDNTVRLWSSHDGELIAVLEGHSDWISETGFSPDNTLIITASGDKTARLWSSDGKLVTTLKGHQDELLHATFSPDSTLIITASEDWTARLWSRDGALIAVLEGHEHLISNAVFSPDNESVLTASWDDTARLWSNDGELIAVLKHNIKGIFDDAHASVGSPSIRFASNGKVIVTEPVTGPARIWSDKGKMLTELSIKDDQKIFSPDEAYFGTIIDKKVRLWSSKGELLGTLGKTSDEVSALAFSPDNKVVVTVLRDGTIKIWPILNEETLESDIRRSYPGLRLSCEQRVAAFLPMVERCQ
ncbi:MAG: hypothetical protein AAF512_12110 [Pseudomonadota bacterium]